jgi:hypothetical protein
MYTDMKLRQRLRQAAAQPARLLREERGAAMVEATISITLLLLLTFGIVQFGLIFYVENSMQNAVRESVRETSVVASGGRQQCSGVSSTVTVADFDLDGATDNTVVAPAEWIACDYVASLPGSFLVDGFRDGEGITVEMEVPLNSILLVDIFGLIGGSSIIVSETMSLE